MMKGSWFLRSLLRPRFDVRKKSAGSVGVSLLSWVGGFLIMLDQFE